VELLELGLEVGCAGLAEVQGRREELCSELCSALLELLEALLDAVVLCLPCGDIGERGGGCGCGVGCGSIGGLV